MDAVDVGSRDEIVDCGGDPNRLVVVGLDSGICGGFGSATQISGWKDPLETESRRTKNILSRCMNSSPVLHCLRVDLFMGRELWSSVVSNIRRATSRQHELTIEARCCLSFLAISYASLLRVIGSRFAFRDLAGILHRGQCVKAQPGQIFLPGMNCCVDTRGT